MSWTGVRTATALLTMLPVLLGSPSPSPAQALAAAPKGGVDASIRPGDDFFSYATMPYALCALQIKRRGRTWQRRF